MAFKIERAVIDRVTKACAHLNLDHGDGPDEGIDALSEFARSLPASFSAEDNVADLSRIELAEGMVEHLLREIRTIYETGRDRIIELGGTCDDVDTMFRHSPALRDARAMVNFQH